MSENTGHLIPINIEDEMRTAYIDYSMSVIISRALPDARDGLKPVHRRVLYTMFENGFLHNRAYKKSARTVGDVMAKYHPHGDTAIYDTMVRMAQPWSLRYPLIDGQGNFGSIDGDSPAAMRYTESRLRRLAEEMLVDINKDTVDFQPNYDDSDSEPSVLPAKLPNLLLNGSSGIAVGMATNMAPHNLSEVLDGVVAYIDNHDITIAELMQHVKAPDFPTGAIIYGYQGVRAAFETGRGRVIMRAVSNFETTKTGREQIIITEIPYMVNKADMIKRIADMVNEKKLDGISGIRDESDRDGIRIVFELRKDAIPNIVLNNLYKYTPLQSSFSINNVALLKGRPVIMNLKDLIKAYVEHRVEVVTRRTAFDLREAEKRAHILVGLLIAQEYIDAVIALIRRSKDPEEARNGLMAGDFMTADQKTEFLSGGITRLNIVDSFDMEAGEAGRILSEVQARAILELTLRRLTGLERDKITAEYDELMKNIIFLKTILENEPRKFEIIKEELAEIKARYGDERRSKIEYAAEEFSDEDMIADEDMLITISRQGYVKRTALSEYRTQSRGGVGSRGVITKDDDFTEHLFAATMLNHLLIFTEFGRLYWLKVYEIPEGGKVSKGRPIQNLINIESGDKVRAVINTLSLKNADYIANNYIIMCTESGIIKKTLLEAYSRPRTNGIIAITINEGDRLLDVALTNGENEIIIASKAGRAVRFNETRVRPTGRGSIGVKGIELGEDPDNRAIGMLCVSRPDTQLLVVSQNGYGKRSEIADYRITNRGAKGVITLNVTEKVGNLVAINEVSDGDDLMIINKSGITIRTSVAAIRTAGRNTQGVKLIKLNNNDEISSVTRIQNEAAAIGEETVGEIPNTDEIVPNTENVEVQNNESAE
jgi:DNA gyrase subunit A